MTTTERIEFIAIMSDHVSDDLPILSQNIESAVDFDGTTNMTSLF
jgi:hypothetical protein